MTAPKPPDVDDDQPVPPNVRHARAAAELESRREHVRVADIIRYALDGLEYSHALAIDRITREGMRLHELDPADGWLLDLPHRSFVRIRPPAAAEAPSPAAPPGAP